MTTHWPTVALTGHRPKHLSPSARDWVRAELAHLAVRLRDQHGMICGISGMALGADLWWADAITTAGAILWPHVPYPQQADRWPEPDRQEWTRLISAAGRQAVTYGPTPEIRHLFARNRGMVNAVRGNGMLLAVWVRGKPGGTCEALRYALDQGMRPTWVDPVRRVTWWPTVDQWRRVLPARSSRRAA